ncbi:MAG: adenylosuccinate synthase [Dehalococcoidia bacterium]|nr:adenylosuccinate synthase [Dehalococcoidia bacterium]
MPAYAIIGGQWGDEGKGKVIDYLSRNAHVVARYAGGNNAGHTVLNEQGEFRLHLVPSGVFWPQVTPVIGNGVVVDPNVLLEEMDMLVGRGVDVSRLQVSERAHVIMPYHVKLDLLEEQARGGGALGTTGRGVGPAYVDKAARLGIRVGDLLDDENLPGVLGRALAQKNRLLTRMYDAEPFALADLVATCRAWTERLRPYVASVDVTIALALADGKNVLLEGAQGALLDVDHGTYPFVTSSNPTVGGAIVGLGLNPMALKGVTGIYKAYTTRVGAGPFPTELNDAIGDQIRQRAWEYGTTTGRARRCGWFDAVAARHSATVNGFTSAIVTRLDVLEGITPLKVCVAYQVDGQRTTVFPGADALARAVPVYEELSGWTEPTAGLTRWDGLPRNAQRYVTRLGELIGAPVAVISTGPNRHETIELAKVMG